jgi:hypothetical protein
VAIGLSFRYCINQNTIRHSPDVRRLRAIILIPLGRTWLWGVADGLIPALFPALERHGRPDRTIELRALLLAISPASMDRNAAGQGITLYEDACSAQARRDDCRYLRTIDRTRACGPTTEAAS